jgi:peptidoglycan/LPS O-acetylase OafA/YrhL
MHPATSVHLDLLRIAAAMVVFAVHAYPVRLTGGIPGLWRVGGLGNDAVMVFFVLSGFLMAYVVRTRESELADYAASRLARLYSVVLPAIVLTVFADLLGSRLAPELYPPQWFATDEPVWRILANLFFINQLWFSSVRLFSNVPFWSLGYEFWYYVLFGLVVFLRGRRRLVAIVAWLAVVGPKILLLLPVWLLGVGVHELTRRWRLGPRTGLAMAVGSVLAYGAFRLLGAPAALETWTQQWLGAERFTALGFSRWFLASYAVGLLVALHLLGISACAALIERVLPARPIRYLASFTLALYLFHFPLLHLAAALLEWVGLGPWRIVVVIPATLLAVWLLGTLTEHRKSALRRWILRSVGSAPPRRMVKSDHAWR